MRLSAKIIKNYCGNNMFAYANEWVVRANEPNTLYFQIVDLDQDGLRYMSAATVLNVSVLFPSIDSANVINAPAVQAHANDKSIFKISLGASQIPASGNVVFQIVEDGITRKFSVLNGIQVEYPGNDGSC